MTIAQSQPHDPQRRVPILLVDDRAEDLAAMAALLSSPEIEPVIASSGTAALRQLLDRDFAVILLDVNMPVMNGFEVAEIIKRRNRSKETPILFLTADASDMNFIYRGYSVGAVDFLQKPIDRDVVRAKVGVFVDLFRKAEALRAADARDRERQLAELAQKSDERYRNLAEAIPQIVWTASKDGAVTYYNKRWHDFTGLAAEPPPPWTTAVHVDDLERCAAEWAAAVARGSGYEGQCRLRDAHGEYRWYLARAVPDRDRDGSVIGFLGTHTDLHDLRTALEEADAAKNRAMFLAEASELLAMSLDYPETLASVARLPVPRLADWCIVDVHQAGGDGEIAVVHVDATKERSLREQYARQRRDEHTESGSEIAATSVLRVPLEIRDRTLGTMVFGKSDRQLTDHERRMAIDLARHAALAVDKARLYLSAQQALHARDDFLSIAAHELRTPLTALQLQLQSLNRRVTSVSATDAGKQKLEVAVRQAARLAGLTERLLDVSRIVGGRLKLDLEELDLSELIKEMADRFAPEAAQAGCTLDVEMAGPARGRWDRLRVEQIITNLLSNAFKYGRGAPVHVKLEQSASVAWVTVHDHGIGIAPQDLSRIFERFERAVTTRQYGGLGIGLYVARQIVEAHGGSIHVESQPGVGSAFTIELPVAPHLAEGS